MGAVWNIMQSKIYPSKFSVGAHMQYKKNGVSTPCFSFAFFIIRTILSSHHSLLPMNLIIIYDMLAMYFNLLHKYFSNKILLNLLQEPTSLYWYCKAFSIQISTRRWKHHFWLTTKSFITSLAQSWIFFSSRTCIKIDKKVSFFIPHKARSWNLIKIISYLLSTLNYALCKIKVNKKIVITQLERFFSIFWFCRGLIIKSLLTWMKINQSLQNL